MDNIGLIISIHAQERFKDRKKIKNVLEMSRRAKQAYGRGELVEKDKNGNETYLFNNFVYVFNVCVEKIVLVTIYKVDLHNGLMKIFVQTHKKRKLYADNYS